jgi:hypothetical protein
MSGLERVHLPNQSVIDREIDRRYLQAQFERSMTWRPPDAGNGGSGGSGSDENDEHKDSSTDRRMPKDALSWLQRSLDGSWQGSESTDAVTTLLLEISQAIRAGRRYPGDQWCLRVRVREELLVRTEIEIAVNAGRMSVSMRTSCDIAFRTISASLGRLNSALGEMNLVGEGVKVFLVSVKDLP